MASDKERVFAFLDETYGGEDIDDYDSPERFLECAIDSVAEEDGLTCGCGVGPLIGHIEAWVKEYAKGQRSEKSEEFILKVSFNPVDLGYQYFLSEDKLKEVFPLVHEKPEGYPVFAKEVIQIKGTKKTGNISVLTYIERKKVSIDT